MNYEKIVDTKKYLTTFANILCIMANKMLSSTITNNITINFIECMIPHHQAAIYMCENLLKYTNYAPLQEIAKNIIKTQTKGIEEMKYIALISQGYLNSSQDVLRYQQQYLKITNCMIFKMKNSPKCCNINLNFINEMIPHHEGAIAMCKNLLYYSISPDLKFIAQSIIKEQSEGILQLKELRNHLCK